MRNRGTVVAGMSEAKREWLGDGQRLPMASTPTPSDGISCQHESRSVIRERVVFPGGNLAEMVARSRPHEIGSNTDWSLSSRGVESWAMIVLGYDNERGKGDHRHEGDREQSLTGIDDLLDRFVAEVESLRRST